MPSWKTWIVPFVLLLALALSPHSGQAYAEATIPAAPLAEDAASARELTLNTEAEIQAFWEQAEAFSALQDLTLNCPVTDEQLAELRAAAPSAALHYRVALPDRSVPSDTEELDLSALSPQQVEEAAQALARLPQLKRVELPDAFGLEEFITLKKAAPSASFRFSFDLYGQTVTADTETLQYANVPIGNDGLLTFARVLPCLDRLRELRMEYCGVSDWAMAELRDAFPEKNIVWRVVCGWANSWSDTDTIWYIGGFGDPQLFPLRYCSAVKYLDIGHNGIYSLDFVRYMPDLEVLIIENDYVSDLCAMSACRKIEYLEVGETRVKDVSPLAACTSLEHLNIGGLLGLEDISPLYDLPKLKRLYGLCDVNVPTEQVEHIKSLMPNTEIDFDYYAKGAVNGGHWRYDENGIVPRYQLLHDQLGYPW